MIFVECCHFVHRCNKGQWPEWIRAVPVGRASAAPLGRGTPSGLRRANLLQRAAGKLFYQWGEVKKIWNREYSQCPLGIFAGSFCTTGRDHAT